MHPLVSVIITTYNLEWCVREVITSVLNQTYPNIEIIVVDDASTDNTTSIIATFGSRIKLIRNGCNNGQPAINRNAGIRAASGEYIAFLDGDDLWAPEKIALQVSAAQQYPAAGLIAVDGIQFLHDDGSILKASLYADDIPWSSGAEIEVLNLYERLLRGCCIDTPSQFMVPRRVLDAVQGFSPNLPYLPRIGYGEDHEFLIRVASRFDFVMINRKLVKYRFSLKSLSGLAQQNGCLDFVLGDISMLRHHLPDAKDLYKPIILKILREKFFFACRTAMDVGLAGKRGSATHYLFNVAKNYLTPTNAKSIAICLARIWTPKTIARIVRTTTPGKNKKESN